MILFNQLECISDQKNQAKFAIGQDDFILLVEPTAQGVFRIQIGSDQKIKHRQTYQRDQQRHKLLVAREETAGEMLMTERKDAWVFTQNGAQLEIAKKHFGFKLYRLPIKAMALMDDTDNEVASLPSKADTKPAIDSTQRVKLPQELDEQSELVLQTDNCFNQVLAYQNNWALMLSLTPKEAVYGLGTTEGNFNRRTEELVSDNPNFRYLPLVWSSKGWGLYLNSFARSIHSIGIKEAPDTYQLRAEDDILDLFLFAAEPAEIFNQYSQLTNKAGQPNLEVMGIWLKQKTGQDEQAFLNLAEQLRGHDIPIDTLSYAWPSLIQFQKDRLALDWDSQRVGDNPRGFFSQLQNEAWHVAIPTFPAVLVDTALFDGLEDRGWLLIDEQGLDRNVMTA